MNDHGHKHGKVKPELEKDDGENKPELDLDGAEKALEKLLVDGDLS